MKDKQVHSPVLKAFLEQSKIDDQSADELDVSKDNFGESNVKKASRLLLRSQDIAEYQHIPTRLKKGELDQKPVVHERMKNNDHSLSMNRWKGSNGLENNGESIEGVEDSDGITMEPT